MKKGIAHPRYETPTIIVKYLPGANMSSLSAWSPRYPRNKLEQVPAVAPQSKKIAIATPFIYEGKSVGN